MLVLVPLLRLTLTFAILDEFCSDDAINGPMGKCKPAFQFIEFVDNITPVWGSFSYDCPTS